MSRVSVVIPCYNYGKFLPECIHSVLDEQPDSDVRVLIIDDASPDDSAEVAHKLAADDGRIEVAVHKENRGHLATFNEGLMDWADGDYCVLLSADDKLTPGSLRRAADLMDSHPEVGFVYGHAVPFYQGKPTPAARTRPWGPKTIFPGRWWLERRFEVGDTCVSSPEVVVRTSLQHKVGPYDSRLRHTSDMEMWMRLALHGDVGYLRTDQAYYRRHDSNMSHAFAAALESLTERRRAYRVLLEHAGDDLADADRLSDVVHRTLAKQALWAAAQAYERGRTAQVPVDDLVAFAFDCWPAADTLRAYRGLQLRRRIGPRTMPYLQPLNLSALARQVMWWSSLVHWRLTGV